MDSITRKTIDSLHPLRRVQAEIVYNKCVLALTGRAQVIFLEGFRTATRSNYLFSLGRTVVNPDGFDKKKKPMGDIVTNAKAWQSIHNYGLAIDFVLLIDGKFYRWDEKSDFDGDKIADWMEVVNIFKSEGWEWGGDWKNIKDFPHVQFDYGCSWQKLQQMYNAGKLIKGTNYVDLVTKEVIAPNSFKVTATLNLRNGEGTDFNIITMLGKGVTVTEISRNGSWSKVKANGVTGYVSNKYLSK